MEEAVVAEAVVAEAVVVVEVAVTSKRTGSVVVEEDFDDDAHPASASRVGLVPAGRAIAVVLVALVACAFLDSHAFVRAGESMPSGIGRSVTLGVARPVDTMAHALGMRWVADNLAAAFGNDRKTGSGGTSELDELADGTAPDAGGTSPGAAGGNASGPAGAGPSATGSSPGGKSSGAVSSGGLSSEGTPGASPASSGPSVALPGVVFGPRSGVAWPHATTGHLLRVLVTGDSLSDFVGYEIADMTSAAGLVQVANVPRNGTGLTNPDFFDWSVNARQEIAARHPDAVVVVMGGNDGWNLTVGARAYAAGTPEWQAAYGRRVAAVARLLSGDGARPVYWSTPPVAESAKWSRIFASQARAAAAALRTVPGARYVDLFQRTQVHGRYSDQLPWHGHLIDARQPDGIHFTRAGAQIPADVLLQVMALDLGRLR